MQLIADAVGDLAAQPKMFCEMREANIPPDDVLHSMKHPNESPSFWRKKSPQHSELPTATKVCINARVISFAHIILLSQ